MGTHPIFESDFDCLTEWVIHQIWSKNIVWTGRSSAQFAVQSVRRSFYPRDQLSCTEKRFPFPALQQATSRKKSNTGGKWTTCSNSKISDLAKASQTSSTWRAPTAKSGHLVFTIRRDQKNSLSPSLASVTLSRRSTLLGRHSSSGRSTVLQPEHTRANCTFWRKHFLAGILK